MGQRIRRFSLAPVAAVANGYALSQKPVAGGVQSLTLNGALAGVADIARRVTITSSGNDSARTFTITGKDRNGRVISENLVGPNTATVFTLNDFAAVTSITVDANTAGNITSGTNQVMSSAWFVVDRVSGGALGVFLNLIGAASSVTVERTGDDPFTSGVGVMPPGGNQPPYLQPYPDPVLNDVVGPANAQTIVPAGVSAVRVTINSFSANAVVNVTFDPAFMEQDS